MRNVILPAAFLMLLPTVAIAQEGRSFENVTPVIFECVKATSEARNGTIYEPRDANIGTATTTSMLRTVIVSFDLDVATGEIRYSIIRKTWIVPTAAIWSGIEETIEDCRAR